MKKNSNLFENSSDFRNNMRRPFFETRNVVINLIKDDLYIVTRTCLKSVIASLFRALIPLYSHSGWS